MEEKPSSEFKGLNKVSGSGFSEAWGRPGAALGDYRVIHVTPLQSSDAEVQQPERTSITRQRWVLDSERQRALADSWDESMQAAAKRHNLDSSSSSNGDKVLVIKAALTRIAPSANLQQAQATPGRNTVYTEDSGAASAEFRVYDQASGELLAVIRDDRRVGNQMWSQANTVTASADMRRLLNSWANQLLSQITGLPSTTE